MKKIILDLCGGTGAWAKPYKDNGYTVHTLTLPDHDVEDVSTFPPEVIKAMDNGEVYGILAAPPCTMFSIARNDKTALEKRDLEKGMRTVNACLSIIHRCLYNPYEVSKNNLKFWSLENPASGYLKRFLGKPTMVFDPSGIGKRQAFQCVRW